MEKDKKPAAPAAKKPALKKPEKKPEQKPVEYKAPPPGKTHIGKPVVDRFIPSPNKDSMRENASLLGRLRRAIGESKQKVERLPGPSSTYVDLHGNIQQAKKKRYNHRHYLNPVEHYYNGEKNYSGYIYRTDPRKEPGKDPFKVVTSKNDKSEDSVTYHPTALKARNHIKRVTGWKPLSMDEEVEIDEARRKSAASLGFISTNAGHGVTASSEPYGDSHLPVVTNSSGNRVDVGHKPYPTPELAQQGAQTFIDNTYTRQGTDPVRGFKALAKHHGENAKKKTNEEIELDELSMGTAFKAATKARNDNPKTAPADPAEREAAYDKHLKRTRQEKKFADYGKRKLAQSSSIPEEVEQTNEAVLSLAQRIKRAQIMRREAPKIERAREISRTRFAREDQLKNRAEVLARRLVKKKFAGQRGYDYQKLSTSEKMAIDAMVDKKVDLIHRLAKKMFPVVKRKEVARMLALHKGINSTPGASPVNIMNSYDPGAEIVEKKLREVPKDPITGGPAKYYEGLTKRKKLARAEHFAKRKKTPAPGDAEAKTKPSKYTDKFNREYNKGEMNEQISGLKKKAEKSGISYGTLKKVYDRGMAAWRTGHRPGTTPQQWAFARVNSFITKGKTYHTADKDLREEVELNEWYIDTANKYKPSRGDSIVTNNGGRVFGRVERVDETSVYFRSQSDQRVYKTEIGNVSKVDHWDGTLNENHSPSCPDYEEKKPSLSKRMKKAINIKEAQRDADFKMEKYVDRSGKTRFRKVRKIDDVDKEEGEG